MRMNELAARILGWANDRNLIEGSTVEKQNVKLVEEFGEFAAGLARGKLDVQADALGDMMVILIIMAKQADKTIALSYDDLVAEAQQGGWGGVDKDFLLLGSLVGCISDDLLRGDDPEWSMQLTFYNVVGMCFNLNMAPAKVLEDVWNIIKDRKGKMVDGVFVKENDAMMASGSNAQ